MALKRSEELIKIVLVYEESSQKSWAECTPFSQQALATSVALNGNGTGKLHVTDGVGWGSSATCFKHLTPNFILK